MKNKTNKRFRIIMCGCTECAGRGRVAAGHFTRKRGSKPCPVCAGDGEIPQRVPVND